MTRGNPKPPSGKKPPVKAKSCKSTTSDIEADSQVKEQWLSRNILNRVGDKLGIPQTQISGVPDTVKKLVEELGSTENIIGKYGADKSALIQILLEIQKENRWLPASALLTVSEKLGVPLSQVYRVATFYKAFSLTPQGRHLVTVCMGTACHVRGSPRLLDRVTDALKINPGESSQDMKFTLETVNCLGCCALGPVMVIDGEYHSNPSAKDIEDLLATRD
ncbi:MAG: NAD(P)H-dependent oxidoreductase subunit E [Chloroflexi bacterium]|nr:NAD(P)H-dependent oxidoreductase subunit E [Chloroflexota bacterium]